MSAPDRKLADQALAEFSNKVQAWSVARLERGLSAGTFGDAASALRVSVQQIADAVEQHYWMFTSDTDLPLAQRLIEHEGE